MSINKRHDRAIKTAIQNMAGTFLSDQIFLLTGKVKSVNESAGTCVVEAVTGRATTEINDVELQAVVADGVFIIPAVDSEVKVMYSTYTDPFIVQYSEVDKIYLAGNLIQCNDGALGGMVKVIDLTTKLNNLENKVNAIISAYNAHVHTANNTPTTSTVTGTLTPTVRADIENTKVKH